MPDAGSISVDYIKSHFPVSCVCLCWFESNQCAKKNKY